MSNMIPEGWVHTPLEDILYRPLAYGVLKPGSNIKDGVPVVRIQDIRGNRLNFDGLYKISAELHKEFRRTKLNEGDLIISLVGTIGKTFVVPTSLHGANVTRAFGVIGVKKGVSPEYVTQWLNSDFSQQWIQDQSQGNAQKVLNLGALKQFPLLLPHLPEQKKIAAILSSVDKVIEKTRAQIDKLKDLKTGMMQELLTKGIGHTEFKDSPVGRIPAGWNVITMESVLNKVIDYRGKSPPKSDCGIPLITAKNIRQGYIDENPKEYIFADQYESWMVRGIPTTGDIFITTEAPLGNVAKVPGFKFAIGQRVLALNPAPCISSDYLLYLMQSRYFQDQLELQSTGSTVAGIKQSTFRKILIPLPPVQEQQSITKPLDSIVRRIDSTFLKLHQAERMKKALMQDLLTGKVRVNVENRELADA